MSDVLSENSRCLLLLDSQHCPLNPGSPLGPLPFTEAWRPSQGPNMSQFHGSLSSLVTRSQGSLCIFAYCSMLWKPLFHTFGTFFLFFLVSGHKVNLVPLIIIFMKSLTPFWFFLNCKSVPLDILEKKKVPNRKTNLNNVIFGESKGNRRPQGVGETMRKEQVRSASTFTKHKDFSFETISVHSMHSLTWSQNMFSWLALKCMNQPLFRINFWSFDLLEILSIKMSKSFKSLIKMTSFLLMVRFCTCLLTVAMIIIPNGFNSH